MKKKIIRISPLIFSIALSGCQLLEKKETSHLGSSSDLEDISEQLENYEVTINYEELYYVTETIDELNRIENLRNEQKIEHQPDSELGKSLQIDADVLYKCVLKNNQRFFEKNQEDDYIICDEDEIYRICKQIEDYVDAKEYSQTLDMDRICCVLEDLCIVQSTEILEDDNAITASEVKPDQMLLILYSNATKKLSLSEEEIKYSIDHEIDHLLQIPCKDMKKIYEESQVGASVFLTGEYNVEHGLIQQPYWYRFLYEASAEENAYKLNQQDILLEKTYSNYFLGFDYLKYITCLNQENDYELETTQYTNSFTPLYELFHVDNPIEQVEFHEMLLGMEIILNTRVEFCLSLPDDVSVNVFFDNSLNIANKFFFKELLLANQQYQDISLEDNYFLMRQYEYQLRYFINDSSSYVIQDFINLQEIMFQYLEKKYPETENIRQIYIDYGDKYIFNNPSLLWMDEEQKEYYENLYQQVNDDYPSALIKEKKMELKK